MAVCPSCRKENPEGFQFCGFCSASLESVSEPAQEERKVVSVLFVDLVGFTARSHDADPEDVRAALAPYHRLLKTEIERFGGTVEKFIGDAVMAVFGAPLAHEDDAERAVRAALRITEAIEELNEATPNLDLSIRAAVNSGEGLVTLGARPQAGEGMVTGDVVNTASRLQGIAPVGGVAVGEITYRSTKDLIEYEELDPVTVKGKPEPIPVWRAVSARSRFGVDVDMAPKTPFIGRDFDLGALKNAYQRTLRESSVQLVTITGEPGVGKTRLLGEFSSFVDEQDEIVYWRQGRSLPYGEGITFWALGEIVKAQAGILESDSPGTSSDKLQVAVDAVVEEVDEGAWFISRLSPLVGVQRQSGGGVEKEESFTAWRRFLEEIASKRPLVLVFEDLHWADAAMLEFIDHMVEWSTGVPLLVVCTARLELYERHPDWGGGKRNSTTISLSSLSDSETAQLISGLLSQAVLPAEVHAALLERAGGNPLYAEEFIRMLSDRGVLHKKGRILTIDPAADIVMPDNVHALIAARLDTLSSERKALLHDASVAGKVFWSGAVSALGGRDDREVREGLHELARKELVRPARSSSIQDQQEYSFWHALVRDVAYGQIPRAIRGHKHMAMGEWIETISGDRAADQAEVLAHHFEEALKLAQSSASKPELLKLGRQTCQFLTLAGNRALALDVSKARSYYERALQFASSDDPQRPAIILGLAKALLSLGEYAEAETSFQEALSQLLAGNDLLGAGEALCCLSGLRWRQGKSSPEVLAPLEQAVSLLQQHPGRQLAEAYASLGSDACLRGDFRESLTWCGKALSLAGEFDCQEVVVEALDYRGTSRAELGDADGIEDLKESVRLGLELGLGRQTATAYGALCHVTQVLSLPRDCVDLATEALTFARSHALVDMEMWLTLNESELLFVLGRWDTALGQVDAVIEWSRQRGAAQYECWAAELKARMCLCQGRIEDAAELLTSFLPQARTIGDVQTVLPSLATAAVIEQVRGRSTEAVQLAEEFEQQSRAHPRIRIESLSFLDVLRVCRATRQTDLAQSLLEDASPSLPFSQCAVVTGQAILAEATDKVHEARDLYQEAAQRWADYGFVLEEGQAYLGLARCLIALGDRGAATEPLHRARAIFERLGAVPLLSEVDGYLGEMQAASG